MDTESTAAEVQPAEAPEGAQGQGADSYHGLYDLSAAPEHLRPLLEAELKKVTSNVDARFRDHADFRKQWEPFEAIEGLRDVEPERLGQLLELNQVISDPAQLESWWFRVGNEMGYFEDDGDAAGSGEADGEVAGDPQLAQMAETLQALTKRLDEFEQRGEQEKTRDQAKAEIEAQLEELRGEHGEFDESLVLRLSRDYLEEPDAIRRGFDDYLRITGQAQSELVDDKLAAPDPATSGGRPDTTAQAPTTFKEAQAAALARLGG